ncbi:exodeoxyribonuclease V subunit gamma [Speluncibacter jeojiensis]|uniref:RecBCD enzyme subunit RecC n=1 Tax=Speluncibacter jeojiensis TaxID=2710754 RepID=A0A9X4LZK7_9ACTN|nr:exodeoxyribonuclease V subunit gamma [Corynebacteriales bacterium D3-21]
MLTLHRAERSDTLAVTLGELLAVPLADPFAREVVAVPAKGVERWLTQHLSATLGARTADGVAANIEFPSPTALVDAALAAATDTRAEDDPWAPQRMRWLLLDIVDAHLGEPWCAVLARHLGHPDPADFRRGRRYGTVAHLTELFRSYAAQRPAMLVDWARGHDTDGAGAELGDLAWQAQLWRLLRERIGSPGPAERLEAACARLRDEPDLVDLPERVSVFGPTRLTTAQLAVLDALAYRRDVHLWIAHHSPALWRTLSELPVGRPLVTLPSAMARAADDSALRVTHPLLAALGRDVRELQQRLSGREILDEHHRGAPAPPTLLGRLQSDLVADRAPVAGAVPDGTVQIHACHGPARQVEVLRECLLHLFQQDETLEPRDVLVMCPDVEAYAPLVRAAFGQDEHGHPGHRLRVRLADRALHQSNPVLGVVAALLALADGRVAVSQVLDLAATEPVRRKFRFTDDDLEQLQQWMTDAGARWGIGKRERRNFGLGDFPQNTLGAALDRVLLGAAADSAQGQWLSLALPLDDVDSNDITLTGRLAEFVDRLDVSLRGLAGPQPTQAWGQALTRALDLLVEVADRDAWQLGQARRELAAAIEHGDTAELRLADIRAMLGARLAGRPSRSNFRTGELTVCTMVPMRSVPHRVVVLLGLDDEVFPRVAGIDGDDVLARNPLIGERDARSEDRQLLLDAVCAAGEQLLLFYTGADPVTGAPRPPAIPLSELRDVLEAMVGADAMGEVVRRHPLQPFDARNFDAAGPFSFDRAALAGAQAAATDAAPEPRLLPAALSPLPPGDVDLSDLVAFAQHPTQEFLRQRLGFRVPDLDEEIDDTLPVELDSLARWGIGQRMVDTLLADPRDFASAFADFGAAEWRRGTLPPAKLGAGVLSGLEADARAVVTAGHMSGLPETIDIDVELGDGCRLTGTVGGVFGDVIARSTFSKLGAKQRLAAWVQLLAVAASRPGERSWRAVTTGRGQFSNPTAQSTLLAPADAREHLLALVALRARGLCAPLPYAIGASNMYAETRREGKSVSIARENARRAWESKFGDGVDRHITYVYGDEPPFTVVTDEPDPGPEQTAFGALARAVWEPLLAAESMGR